MNLKSHWENIYTSKTEDQMSWYEEYPTLSLKYLEEKKLPKDAAILDVGGGQSRLAEVLMDKGYTNISVLDISEQAIENTKKEWAKKQRK
jgi:2-polyprenyl-3-methyl-5-hydroxy-6-metoxy-1,4-benzoquinol methylase